MKRTLPLLALAALTLALQPATAADTYTGRILIGHPVTHTPVFAVTDRLAPCDPASPYNGIDAVWFYVPDRADRAVALDMDPTLDGAAFFWNNGTGSCALIQYFTCANLGRGRREMCVVPAGTTHITVEGFAGTGAFVLTVA